jgi:hypothetical protein
MDGGRKINENHHKLTHYKPWMWKVHHVSFIPRAGKMVDLVLWIVRGPYKPRTQLLTLKGITIPSFKSRSVTHIRYTCPQMCIREVPSVRLPQHCARAEPSSCGVVAGPWNSLGIRSVENLIVYHLVLSTGWCTIWCLTSRHVQSRLPLVWRCQARIWISWGRAQACASAFATLANI